MNDKSETTKFDVTPDESELKAMQRDIRFFPTSEPPSCLTQKQLDDYNRLGYLSGIQIFSNPEILNIQNYFNQLLEEVIANGGDSYSISSAHLTYGKVFDLLTDSRIVEHVANILGDNVIGWGAHFFCKMPHDGKSVSWHQDASYWPLTPSKTATVWLAIDDASIENGCMRFIETSHHAGQLDYIESTNSEQNVLNQTIKDAESMGRIVNNELPAGAISIHTDLLLHGSNANDSDRRRCGLTLRYCTADVIAGLDWHKKGIVVRGQDIDNRWANVKRPPRD